MAGPGSTEGTGQRAFRAGHAGILARLARLSSNSPPRPPLTMAKVIDKTVLATQDIEELTAYYLAEAGMAVALRFVDQAEHAFIHLAQMPRMGQFVGFQHPKHADIRRWHIQGFPRLLILYRAVLDGIQLLRVLDAGRDFHALFDDADVPLT